MPNDLTYRIVINPDTGGLQAVQEELGALNAQAGNARGGMNQLADSSRKAGADMNGLGARSMYASTALMSIQRVAQGDVTAVMGLAQAVRALWQAFAAGSGPIGLVIVALMAVYKGLTMWTEKIEESNKKLQEANDELGAFSASLRDLLAKQNEVVYSLDRHINRLQQISGYYADAAKASSDYAAAQKSVANAEKELGLAQVSATAARRLLAAAGNPAETARVQLEEQRARAAVENEARQRELGSERQRINRDLANIRATLRDLQTQRAPAPEIAAQQKALAGLKEKRETTPLSPKEYLALTTQIGERTAKLDEDRVKDSARRRDIEQKIVELNSQQNDLISIQLANNQKLSAALDEDVKAQSARFDLQEKQNAAAEKELKTKAQIAALSKQEKEEIQRAAAAKAVAEKLIPKLKEQEDKAKARAEYTARLAADPAFAKAEEKKERERQNLIAQARRRGFAVAAGATTEDIENALNVQDALAAKKRGVRSAAIDRVLAADAARKAAGQAQQAREQAEKQQAQNIAKSEEHLRIIKEKMNNLAIS